MKRGSDFVFTYLRSLTDKELEKLKSLMQIDAKRSELRMVELIETTRETDEQEICKKSGYSKKSFHKIKSDLKNYIMNNSCYQSRDDNQHFLERISIAQGLMRRGFVNEGTKTLDEVIKQTAHTGADLYPIVALRNKTMSVFYTEGADRYGLYKTISEIETRLRKELDELPCLSFAAQATELWTHDPGLRKPGSKKTLSELRNSFTFSADTTGLTLFNHRLTLSARAYIYLLIREFKNTLGIIDQVLQSSQEKETNVPSLEFIHLLELQCKSALMSRHPSLIKKHVSSYVKYFASTYPKNESHTIKFSLYKCWEQIFFDEIKTAEHHFSIFKLTFTRILPLLSQQQRHDYMTQAMLLSLNLSAKHRSDLLTIAAANRFNPEWNEAYNNTYRLWELFIRFDEVVLFNQKRITILDDSLFVHAARIKDLFRKKKNRADYSFEIALCNLFLKFRKNTEASRIVPSLFKFINYCQKATSETKVSYVILYHDYFNFTKWAVTLLDKLSEQVA